MCGVRIKEGIDFFVKTNMKNQGYETQAPWDFIYIAWRDLVFLFSVRTAVSFAIGKQGSMK